MRSENQKSRNSKSRNPKSGNPKSKNQRRTLRKNPAGDQEGLVGLRLLQRLGLALAVALLLELTLFQYRTYWTMGEEPVVITKVQEQEGLERQGDGSFRVTNPKKAGLEVTGLELALHTMQLAFVRYDEEGNRLSATAVTVSVTDEANSEYLKLPERTMVPQEVTRSQYLTLHLSGKTDRLLIQFDAEEGETLVLEQLVLNARIPLAFSWICVVLLTLALTAGFYLRPGAGYWRCPFRASSSEQRAMTTLLCCGMALLFTVAACLNPWFLRPSQRHHQQYHELAVALSKGQLYLEEEPPEALQEMENPYDTAARRKVMEETDSSFLLDHAYYQGHYYVYFGILPVLTFYLPWYLVTGTAFPTAFGVLLCGLGLIFAVFWLMRLLVERYFDGKIPYLLYLMVSVLFLCGCGALTIMRRPDFYSLPILMGVMLSVLGLCFWISSIQETSVSPRRLFLGCLCMALVLACRPQLMLGSFLIFPIFWTAVFQRRLLFTRKTTGRTLLAAVPYLVVGAGIMCYNALRFGSPFDFGANYNLTTNDMTGRGWVWARLPIAFFTYLLQPPVITAEFPFINKITLKTGYLGRTISEATFGGFFAVNPFALFALTLLRRKRTSLKEGQRSAAAALHRPRALGLTALLLALLIVAIDAEGAGILLRYYSDFGWLLFLAAVSAFFMLWSSYAEEERVKGLLYGAFTVVFAAGMVFQLLLTVTDGGIQLRNTNPGLFYTLYYELQFWR